MNPVTRAADHFKQHPVGWIFFGVVVFGFYSNWSIGNQLTRVCELAFPAIEIRVSTSNPVDDGIAAWSKERERISKEDSPAGALYRWQLREGRRIENACADRLN